MALQRGQTYWGLTSAEMQLLVDNGYLTYGDATYSSAYGLYLLSGGIPTVDSSCLSICLQHITCCWSGQPVWSR